jgi:hypothetical protein
VRYYRPGGVAGATTAARSVRICTAIVAPAAATAVGAAAGRPCAQSTYGGASRAGDAAAGLCPSSTSYERTSGTNRPCRTFGVAAVTTGTSILTVTSSATARHSKSITHGIRIAANIGSSATCPTRKCGFITRASRATAIKSARICAALTTNVNLKRFACRD